MFFFLLLLLLLLLDIFPIVEFLLDSWIFSFLNGPFFLSVNNQRLNWLENAITFHLTAAAVAVAQVLRDDERTSITEESNVKMRVKSSKVELKIGSTAQ